MQDKTRQEASAIIVKILKLLEAERLSVKDSERILGAAKDALRQIPTPVCVPEDIPYPRGHQVPSMERING